jgi:hypothetical protein
LGREIVRSYDVIPTNFAAESTRQDEGHHDHRGKSAAGRPGSIAGARGGGADAAGSSSRVDREPGESRSIRVDARPIGRLGWFASRVVAKARQGPKALALAVIGHIR